MTPGALLRLTVLGIGVLACQPSGAPPTSDSSLVAGAKIGTPPPAVADGEWSLPARDYANSRFSNLAEITSANVKNLHVAWTF